MLNSTSNRPDVRDRPHPGTLTGRVWEIADEITREKGRRAERREVIERYVAEKGNRTRPVLSTSTGKGTTKSTARNHDVSRCPHHRGASPGGAAATEGHLGTVES